MPKAWDVKFVAIPIYIDFEINIFYDIFDLTKNSFL